MYTLTEGDDDEQQVHLRKSTVVDQTKVSES
jgi:hypothetical protein